VYILPQEFKTSWNF